MLGYPAEELIGKPIWEFAAPDARESSETSIRRKLADGAMVAPHVAPYLTKDGRRLWIEAHERVIVDGEGTASGIRATLLDITARRQAEEEIRRLNAELEERVRRRTAELQRSNEDLQQFAYVVSHDLQEPLRAISGYTSLIEKRYKRRLDSDADEFIDFVVEGAERMQRLITDLLEYSRVGSRDARPYRPVHLGAALDAALLNLQRAVEESGARIERSGTLPEVLGDEQRLAQLLQNLVGNAIKYRGSEAPVIRVSAEPAEGYWLCSVADNGIGFDMQHANRIFGVFRRLHGAAVPRNRDRAGHRQADRRISRGADLGSLRPGTRLDVPFHPAGSGFDCRKKLIEKLGRPAALSPQGFQDAQHVPSLRMGKYPPDRGPAFLRSDPPNLLPPDVSLPKLPLQVSVAGLTSRTGTRFADSRRRLVY